MRAIAPHAHLHLEVAQISAQAPTLHAQYARLVQRSVPIKLVLLSALHALERSALVVYHYAQALHRLALTQ